MLVITKGNTNDRVILNIYRIILLVMMDAEYIIKKHKELIKTLPKQKAYDMIYLKKVMADYLKSKYPDKYKPAKSIEEILNNLK